MSLSKLNVGVSALVTALNLDSHEVDWLRAVGLFEGTRVRVLRRAPFGGPLHLRTASGAEFAVDRQLAERVGVAVDVEGAQ